MNFRDIFIRISRYFKCFKRDNKAKLNLDEDILEAEYGKLNDPEDPNFYF